MHYFITAIHFITPPPIRKYPQTLLEYENPFAYTCGAYGWKADFYQINNICVSTGYSPIGKTAPYDVVEKYEREAMKNKERYYITHKIKKFETLRRRNYKLLCAMLAEVDAL